MEDINESDLPFYTSIDYFNNAFRESNVYERSIKSRCQIVPDTIKCLEDLAVYDDRICFLRSGLLKGIGKHILKFRNHEFKVAKPVFNCLNKKYSFEKSSPYAEKFFYTFRHIHESGINRILEPIWKHKIVTSKSEKENDEGFFFLISLLVVLFFGYTISVAFFFYRMHKMHKYHKSTKTAEERNFLQK